MPRPPKKSARTHGPLEDLEVQLKEEWWQTLFNANYLKTDGDVVENPDNTRAEVDLLIRAANLTPDQAILDLCCGQGRHTLELATRGFQRVQGIDQSRYLLGVARRRAKQRGLKVPFRQGDMRKLTLARGSLDCVTMMGNSFGYFQHANEDLIVLGAVHRALKTGGILALDLTDGPWLRRNFEPRSWEWLNREELVVRERQLSGDKQRIVCREVIIHASEGVVVDQFYAERLYDRPQLEALLSDSGFVDITLHEMVEGGSTRGQDLGMMAHRFFYTARAAAHAVARAQPPRRLTVLLGDPSLPDPVKRGGTFNPEDFDTVDRLQKALATLPGVSIRYLDHHARLTEDLEADDGELIVNFCDEGLRNDAALELHVPALLEALGRPYTGSGPACLGLCHNKAHVRAIAAGMGIPVPKEVYIPWTDPDPHPEVSFPAIVKPNLGDGSFGIYASSAVVHTQEELEAQIATLRAELPGKGILVQGFLEGAEYHVCVIGNPGHGLRLLPILEVDYSALPEGSVPILGYESKWHIESPYCTDIAYPQAHLGLDQGKAVVTWASQLFERLGCQDYARFDFRADREGVIHLLEVNPNPGWCWDGKMNHCAESAGWSYAELLSALVNAALIRLGKAPLPALAQVEPTPHQG